MKLLGRGLVCGMAESEAAIFVAKDPWSLLLGHHAALYAGCNTKRSFGLPCFVHTVKERRADELPVMLGQLNVPSSRRTHDGLVPIDSLDSLSLAVCQRSC